MALIFVDELPRNVRGRYAHYKHNKNVKGEWIYCDIRKFIHEHQSAWLKNVEDWHARLSSVAFKYTDWWWFLPAARLIAWYPPTLKPFFFAVGVTQFYLSSSSEDLYVVGCPEEVLTYIREFKTGIDIRCPQKIFPSPANKSSALKQFLKSFKQWLLLLKLCVGKRQVLKPFSPSRTILFSYLLNADALTERGDHFYGQVLEQIPAKEKGHVLWFFVDNDPKDKQRIRNHFQKRNEEVLFLSDILTLGDWMKMALIVLRIKRDLRKIQRELPVLKVGGFESQQYTQIFYQCWMKNEDPWMELAVYFAFERLMKKGGAARVIYPYEEKGIERALLLACWERAPTITTIGFAHAIYNECLLYLRQDASGIPQPPKPDFFATTGKAVQHWLERWAHVPLEKMIHLGSPRFMEPLPLRADFNQKQTSLRVLILISQGFEVGMLANYLEEMPGVFEQCEVIIRPYPYAWDEEQREGLERIKKILHHLRVEQASLTEQLRWCDAAIYCSSSAAMEAMLSGRLSIYLDLNDVFNLDPIQGKTDGEKIYKCFSALELKKSLTEIQQMSLKEYKDVLEHQFHLARQIYTPVSMYQLKKILQPEALLA